MCTECRPGLQVAARPEAHAARPRRASGSPVAHGGRKRGRKTRGQVHPRAGGPRLSVCATGNLRDLRRLRLGAHWQNCARTDLEASSLLFVYSHLSS